MPEVKEHLIWCGPDDVPREVRGRHKHVLQLWTDQYRGNVKLNVENVRRKLARDLPAIISDMLEVGSYVYSADQAIPRGGKVGIGHGRDWYRNLRFDIPVRSPETWNRPEVLEALIDVLGFLSDDNYEFNFRKLSKEIPLDGYIDFDKGKPWFDADEVISFSGGLDSLAGTIVDTVSGDKKVVLVSHRPVAKISTRQLNLVRNLGEQGGVADRLLHIPVWVNKKLGFTKDENQRCRSFLYAMLAAVVAVMHRLNSIKFFENGIVSINLPLSAQMIGARASRSTHPKTLRGLSKFFSALLDYEFKVENPFIWKTKSDIVQLISDAGLSNLIQHSVSCGHVRSTDTQHSHCGVCTQCLERRFATIYNGLEEDDPLERYQVKQFLDPITKREDRVMVESYVNHTSSLGDISSDEFFQRFGEVNRVLNYVNLPASKAAKKIYELHVRHGEQVCTVIDNEIKRHAGKIRRRDVHPDSLLTMLIDQRKGKLSSREFDHTFPTPEEANWEDVTMEIVSNDSVRIKVLGITKRYSALDMGFRDRRRNDLTNDQWDLLVDFAEASGMLSWANPARKTAVYKDVQALRKILKRFFGISESPIKSYQKRVGYVAQFKIKDLRFGQS